MSTDTKLKVTFAQKLVLQDIRRRRHVDIRTVSEAYRQAAIDLGMMEPPMVEIEADMLRLTDAGRAAA